MRLAYPVKIKERDGTLAVTFPDWPDLAIEAASRPEAFDAARAALVAALRETAREHRDVPRPSAGRVGELIELPLLIGAKVALYQTMRDQNVNNVALADRIGTVEGTVRRLVDLGHRSHIEPVEAALAALGKRLLMDLHLRN